MPLKLDLVRFDCTCKLTSSSSPFLEGCPSSTRAGMNEAPPCTYVRIFNTEHYYPKTSDSGLFACVSIELVHNKPLSIGHDLIEAPNNFLSSVLIQKNLSNPTLNET